MLSPRLETILTFVEGQVLADIGTDHGYLPIAACMEEKIKNAIACDISAGPLERARENIRRYDLKYGIQSNLEYDLQFSLNQRIQTRLGFGLRPLKAKEADCVVIAGMGGMNIIEILQDPESAPILNYVKRLIVQPQRDIPKVRRVLDEMDFRFIDEVTVREKHRFYTVIAVDGDSCGW